MALAGAPFIAKCEQNACRSVMDAAALEPRPPHRPDHPCPDALLRERLPLGIADDPLAGHSTRVGAVQDMTACCIELPAILQSGHWTTTRMVQR